ncbi:MAG TPA: hypothetical protein VEL31_26585 [Ktedonobacteraceae bacterium]|nr:hypothetical protein [Ktedonobacteraceae bacterium]
MSENARRLSEAFAQTPKNELELRLQAQAKPGYLPEGSLRGYVLDAVLRGLKVTDPQKYQRIRQAQVNHEDVDISAILRGEVQ